jgi:hypothetical protein
VQFLREVENRGLGDCSTLGIKNARDWTSAGVCGHADQVAKRTGRQRNGHLASQLKTGQVASSLHQVALLVYYYKRVTFYEMIKKSHTYF